MAQPGARQSAGRRVSALLGGPRLTTCQPVLEADWSSSSCFQHPTEHAAQLAAGGPLNQGGAQFFQQAADGLARRQQRPGLRRCKTGAATAFGNRQAAEQAGGLQLHRTFEATMPPKARTLSHRGPGWRASIRQRRSPQPQGVVCFTTTGRRLASALEATHGAPVARNSRTVARASGRVEQSCWC